MQESDPNFCGQEEKKDYVAALNFLAKERFGLPYHQLTAVQANRIIALNKSKRYNHSLDSASQALFGLSYYLLNSRQRAELKGKVFGFTYGMSSQKMKSNLIQPIKQLTTGEAREMNERVKKTWDSLKTHAKSTTVEPAWWQQEKPWRPEVSL